MLVASSLRKETVTLGDFGVIVVEYRWCSKGYKPTSSTAIHADPVNCADSNCLPVLHQVIVVRRVRSVSFTKQCHGCSAVFIKENHWSWKKMEFGYQ